jgi:hypothetical protein
MDQSSTLYVGLDVHQDSIAAASVAQDHGAEVTYLGTIGTRHADSITSSEHSNPRLNRRLMARGKHANQVVVAIARELVGFMWAIAKQVPVTPSGHNTAGE